MKIVLTKEQFQEEIDALGSRFEFNKALEGLEGLTAQSELKGQALMLQYLAEKYKGKE